MAFHGKILWKILWQKWMIGVVPILGNLHIPWSQAAVCAMGDASSLGRAGRGLSWKMRKQTSHFTVACIFTNYNINCHWVQGLWFHNWNWTSIRSICGIVLTDFGCARLLVSDFAIFSVEMSNFVSWKTPWSTKLFNQAAWLIGSQFSVFKPKAHMKRQANICSFADYVMTRSNNTCMISNGTARLKWDTERRGRKETQLFRFHVD